MVKITQKTVTFKIKTDGNEVILKGSWNGWQDEKMKKDKKGYFSKRKKIAPGVYEFGYLIDGEWHTDESLPLTDSPFGSKNSVLKVEK